MTSGHETQAVGQGTCANNLFWVRLIFKEREREKNNQGPRGTGAPVLGILGLKGHQPEGSVLQVFTQKDQIEVDLMIP